MMYSYLNLKKGMSSKKHDKLGNNRIINWENSDQGIHHSKAENLHEDSKENLSCRFELSDEKHRRTGNHKQQTHFAC